MAWTDEMVEDLRKMWKEGLTTGEIGKRLGVSKNSIVGKVHRLGLSGRPSPIKKKETPTETAAETEKAPKKSKETSAPVDKKENKPENKKEKKETAPAHIKEETPLAPAKDPLWEEKKRPQDGKVSLTDLDNHTCRWPIGDPKDENFHFCGKKVRIGQTYCDEHAAIAYVKVSKK